MADAVNVMAAAREIGEGSMRAFGDLRHARGVDRDAREYYRPVGGRRERHGDAGRIAAEPGARQLLPGVQQVDRADATLHLGGRRAGLAPGPRRVTLESRWAAAVQASVAASYEPGGPRSVATTRTARIWMDDGILHVEVLPGCTQTREDAIETLATNWRIGRAAARVAGSWSTCGRMQASIERGARGVLRGGVRHACARRRAPGRLPAEPADRQLLRPGSNRTPGAHAPLHVGGRRDRLAPRLRRVGTLRARRGGRRGGRA